MRAALLCLAAGLMALGACSKTPGAAPAATNVTQGPSVGQASAPAAAAAASGPAISGVFTGDGQQSTLTQVTAHTDEPFDGKPVTALVFTVKDQGGDAKAAEDALFGNFGDAMVIKVQPDGTVVEADVVHSGLKSPGSVSLSGVMTIKGYSASGGQISGELTSGGPTDLFDHKLNVDLTFHAKAP
ncbi:MAG: hypothetical protein ACHP7N_05485 [Caulobacterales bacterium]